MRQTISNPRKQRPLHNIILFLSDKRLDIKVTTTQLQYKTMLLLRNVKNCLPFKHLEIQIDDKVSEKK